MKIEDNFLEPRKFNALQNVMLGDNFPWFYNSTVVHKDEISDKFQFIHGFYIHNVSQSSHTTSAPQAVISTEFETLKPILEIINPISLWRIKANLLTRTSSINEQTFHIDIDDFRIFSENLNHWRTAIFYVNTNNGYTEFEDGVKVESVANRLVSFPTQLKHRGTSCTDEKTRVVINFNYFK